MTADEPGEIFRVRQKIDFLEKVQRLRIISIDPVRVAVEFLRERNQHPEVSSLSEFGQFESLQLANALSSHSGCAKMFGGTLRRVVIARRNELAITNQVLRHP